MTRFVGLMLISSLVSGCSYVTQRQVLALVGEVPDPTQQEQGEGLLKAVDELERQLTTLETNIKEGGLVQEWLVGQNHQINARYEAELRRIYLTDPPGRDGAADQELRRLEAQQVLGRWTQELVVAAEQAKALELQVSSLRASVSELKAALVVFKSGKGKGHDIKTFNTYLQRSTELVALSHALSMSLAGYSQARQVSGGVP